MIGLDRKTGKVIEDEAYLKDRIQSCLSMRIGTHPMRRLKGSRLPEMLDRPLNDTTLFELKVAVLDALEHPANGLDDFAVHQVKIDSISSKKVVLNIIFKQAGKLTQLDGIEISR